MDCSWHLDVHFSSNFVIPRNLLKRNKYHAKTSFLPFRASCFGIENLSNFDVFSGNVPGHSFFILCITFVRNCSIFGPLRNLVGSKRAPILALVAPKRLQRRPGGCQKYGFFCVFWFPSRRPPSWPPRPPPRGPRAALFMDLAHISTSAGYLFPRFFRFRTQGKNQIVEAENIV